MIAVIDYGMGNLRSVQKGFERIGARAEITRTPGVIADAEGVVLPGVGAFHACMQNLARYELIEPIKEETPRINKLMIQRSCPNSTPVY